jgi:ATP-binding cassette subfamily B protein
MPSGAWRPRERRFSTLKATREAAAGSNVRWWSRLAPYLDRRTLWVSSGLSVIGQVLLGLPPLIQKIILDDAVLARRRPLLPWLAALAGVGVVGAVLHYQRRYLASRTSLELMHRLRVALQRHLHTLDVASQEQLSTGDVMSRATGDVTLVQAFVFQIPLMVANATLLVTAIVVMLYLSPLLSLVIAVFVPLFVFFSVRFRDRVFPSSFNDQQAVGALAGVVEEAVAGVRVVKAFGQEQQELSLFLDRARDLFRSRLRTARLTAHYSATLQALPTFAQLAVLGVGGLLTLHQNISLGVFLAFCSYVVQLLAPLRQLSNILANSQQGRVGAERVFELLSRQALVKDPPNALALAAASGKLRLDHVSFGYPGKATLLHDLSLEIEPGERLGIVGSSGSGKTTLALLLARFYDPTAGTVRLDDHDLRELELDSLRRNVCVVFEESFLFSMSVRENIAFARPDASIEEIEAAARAAQAHDFITELPQGYDTSVGERGTLLSGGQRQRVALARAFLANPKVLILDDATSALDANTEESIHRSLEQQMQGRTTIIIAHRQSTLRLATRAIALDGGRIAVDGSPAQLLESSSLYRRLLTGPDVTDELDEHAGEPQAVDPRAWPEGVVRDGAARSVSIDSQVSMAASRGGGGGGGPGGGGPGGRAAFVTATPELLERIARLPPLRDEPEVDLSQQVAPGRGPLQLRDLARPFTTSLLIGLGLLSVDALTSLAAPLLIGRAVDGAILTRNALALGWIVLGLFVVQVVSWLDARAVQLQTARTAERMLFALRARTFAHLQRLSLDYFDREVGGRIMARMTTDIEAFSQLFQQGILTAVVSFLTSGGVFVVLLALDLPLSLGAFAVLPLLFGGTAVLRRYTKQAYLRSRERIARVYAALQEDIAGLRITQAFARRRETEQRFAELSASYRDARLRSMQLMSFYFPFIQLLSVLAKVGAIAIGVERLGSGAIGAGVLITFLLYLDQFFSPLQQLSQVFDQWIQARVSLDRVRELLAAESSTPEPRDATDPGKLKGEIRFENVRFAYAPGAPEAMRGIDFVVEPGQTVGLVGTTGAGKSTFVKLAARFYDPSSGRITVDGVPLTHMAMTPFREQLGYVPQEPHLFSGTVLSNIRYGRPEASDLEVERAARAVGAHEFIRSLPQGYLTSVLSGGRSLSAGQRQLVCLARAELKNPAILILDEATANLDLTTEAEVQRAMRRVARNRTTLLIAHRLQTARHADRILVLEHGRVVESGPHDELVNAGGRYAKLWEAFRRSGGTESTLRASA